MNGTLVDVHTHLLPDLHGMPAMVGVAVEDDDRLVVDGHRIALAALYDAPALVEFLSRNGLDEAWVSPPPPTYRPGLEAGEAEVWARALNAGMQARVAGYPSLASLTYLPFDHPQLALEMATEVSKGEQIAGWTASAGGASVALDNPGLEPLWHVLEEGGLPLLLHPGESPDSRLQDHYLSNLLGNPVETGIAVAQLLLGGVLDRHPELKVVLVHCAGVVPALVGRWARGVETRRPGIAEGTRDPRQTLRWLWTDCLAHSAAAVDLALEVIGPDRLVLGSDYPFPMGLDNPYESIAHLEPELRDRIALNATCLRPRSAT